MQNPIQQLATLCYVKKDNHTLMLHRIKKENDVHEGKWNGLGGKAQAGETPEECAIREVREECGLTPLSLEMCGFITFPLFSHGKDWYVFVFIIREFEGELIDSPEGELAWIPDSEVLSLNLWEGDRVFLPWLEMPGFFSAKFEYENGRYQSHSVIFSPPK